MRPLFVVLLVLAMVAVLALVIYQTIALHNLKKTFRGPRGQSGHTGSTGMGGQTGAGSSATPDTILTVSSNTVLTAAQSPALIQIDASGNTPISITLPPVNQSATLRFRFVILVPGTADVSIVHAPDSAIGVISFDIIQTSNQAINNSNLEFFVGGSQTVGDFMNYSSDVTGWQINTLGSASSSISFTP